MRRAAAIVLLVLASCDGDSSGARETATTTVDLTATFRPPGEFRLSAPEAPAGTAIAVIGRCAHEHTNQAQRWDETALASLSRQAEVGESPAGTWATFLTDAEGQFEGELVIPDDLPAGDYRVAVSCNRGDVGEVLGELGFSVLPVRGAVPDTPDSDASFAIEPLDVADGGELTITGRCRRNGEPGTHALVRLTRLKLEAWEYMLRLHTVDADSEGEIRSHLAIPVLGANDPEARPPYGYVVHMSCFAGMVPFGPVTQAELHIAGYPVG